MTRSAMFDVFDETAPAEPNTDTDNPYGRGFDSGIAAALAYGRELVREHEDNNSVLGTHMLRGYLARLESQYKPENAPPKQSETYEDGFAAGVKACTSLALETLSTDPNKDFSLRQFAMKLTSQYPEEFATPYKDVIVLGSPSDPDKLTIVNGHNGSSITCSARALFAALGLGKYLLSR